MDVQPTDSKFSLGKIICSALGTLFSKSAEWLQHITLSDMAGVMTIVFTACQIWAFFEDRRKKRGKK